MADLTRKTANLFDVSTVGAIPYTDANGTPSANKGTLSDGVFSCTYGYYGSRIYINQLATVTTGTYTFSADVKSSAADGALRIIKDDGTVIFTENYTDITTDYSRKSKTFTIDTDCSIRISLQGKGNAETYQTLDFMFKNIMLVQGTATEYEPYGWVHSLRKLTTATEAVENPLYSDGTPITSYTIKGNTVQNGTPSPSNPVMPNGVGVRTANLFDKQAVTNNERVVYTDGTTAALTGVDVSDYIPLETGETYTLNISSSVVSKTGHLYAMYDSSKNFVDTGQHPSTGAIIYSFTVPNGVSFIRFNSLMTELDNVMLVKGSYTTQTFPSYEPYGYKIPISTFQTVNNYLGSIQSTRQIGKLVLDGTENWETQGITSTRTVAKIAVTGWANIIGLCSHIVWQASYTTENNRINYGSDILYISLDNTLLSEASLNGFKAYLAQQYAAGTPVTLYYVLATAETAAVNEPLMKIGTYADTLSNAASIPTAEGANSITVDTTVQPSEFTATWTGWHNASVQEYVGGVGNQKFDKNATSWVYSVTNLASGNLWSYGGTGQTIRIPCKSSQAYTLNCNVDTTVWRISTITTDDIPTDGNPVTANTVVYSKPTDGVYTFTTGNSVKYILFQIGSSVFEEGINALMLNEGSTALPYEAYQYDWE